MVKEGDICPDCGRGKLAAYAVEDKTPFKLDFKCDFCGFVPSAGPLSYKTNVTLAKLADDRMKN